MATSQTPTVFVSATSRGLRALRVTAADHLRGRGYGVVVQEEFDCDYQRIKDMIRKELAPCDAVVLLVGPAYGFEPTDWPAALPRCSYTQLEHEVAVELGKPVYRYFAAPSCSLAQFDPEPDDHRERQAAYIGRLRAADHVWYEFDSQEKLIALLGNTQFHRQVHPNLPFASIGTLFKGRDGELARVRRSLMTRPAHATAVTSKQAVHGLGGVGKTRFAVEYAYRYAAEYSARLYANADAPAALDASLAGLCDALDLPERHELEQPRRLDAVRRWLRLHAGWLLILDNVDTPEAQSAVRAAVGGLAGGHVLITSRLTDWGGGVTAVELDTLPVPASTEFLLERTAGSPAAPTGPRRRPAGDDLAQAEGLAVELGGLALALEQAGAYICAVRGTLAEYRTRLAEADRAVLEWFDPAVMNYPRSVAATWQASVAKLRNDERALLELLAFLAPDPIPVGLVTTEPVAPPARPIADRERALADLATYSLAQWSADGGSVTVHRLVQDVTRRRLPTADASAAVRDAVEVVWRYTFADWQHPTDPAQLHLWDGVAAHAEAVARRSSGEQASDELLTVVGNLAGHRTARGRYADAIGLLEGVLAACDDPVCANACTASNNLAEVYRMTNRPMEAKAIYDRLLGLYESVLEVPAEWVIRTRSNLGLVYQQLNRGREARECFRAALRVLETLPDERPSDIANVLNLLGVTHLFEREWAAAVPYLSRSLALREEHVGADSMAVARTVGNLAAAAMGLDDAGGAEGMLLRSLDIYEKECGRDHPELVGPLTNLAELYRETGRPHLAEPLYGRVVANVEANLDPWHPDLASAVNGLAMVCEVQRRDVEAERFYARALAVLDRFGIETGHPHPNLLAAYGNMGTFLEGTLGLSYAQACGRMAQVIKDTRARVAAERPG